MLYYLTGLLAVSSYALLPVISKKIQADIPSFAYIAITMFFLSIFAGLVSFFTEKNYALMDMSYQNWIIIAGFSVVNLIGFSLLLFTISKIPVVEYQLIGVLTPIISGIFAHLILNEVITAKHLLGLAFISVGLFIALKK